MKAPVILYLRIKSADGGWSYARAATEQNGRFKPLCAVVNGRAQYHPEGIYNLRYVQAGKRKWEPVGSDATLAKVALLNRTAELAEAALNPIASPAPEAPTAEPSKPKRTLSEHINEYLKETEAHKSRKTWLAYRVTLLLFADCLMGAKLSRKDLTDPKKTEALLASLSDRSLEAVIGRSTIMDFFAYLKNRGNDKRTESNRATYLRTFIKWSGGTWPLRKNDMPKPTAKKTRAYDPIAIGKMFGYATRDEADLLSFFLCTGVREQEAAHACWTDIDFSAKTYQVTEHLDLGFKPKDKEEGIIPITDELIELLQNRRLRYPGTRLIFPAKGGKSDGHMLRAIKSLALRAGVNCGECVNKKGRSCATHPVCKKAILHKMRKTFATILHQNGVTARTLMGLLRHSDLKVTLGYLGEQDEGTTRQIAASAFGSLMSGGAA